MDVKLRKRIFYFIIGLIVLAFGVALTIFASNTTGSGSWDATTTALNQLFPVLSIGNWLIVVSTILCILSGILLKQFPRFQLVITSIIMGYVIDFSLFLINHFTPHLNRYIAFGLGLIVIAIGTSIYIPANLFTAPVDFYMHAISIRFNISLGLAKVFSEATAFIIAFLLHGPIQFGTVLILFAMGPLIQLFYGPISKFVLADINKNEKE